MRNVGILLGTIWQLPWTILCWLFYILPIWGLGWIEYIEFVDFLVVGFRVKKGSWIAKYWKDWLGWGGPNVIMVRWDVVDLNGGTEARTIKHELRHVYQGLVFGILLNPVYIVCSIFIYFFQLERHAYLDNPFERDARRYAGQQVDLMSWQKPIDRWPWW